MVGDQEDRVWECCVKFHCPLEEIESHQGNTPLGVPVRASPERFNRGGKTHHECRSELLHALTTLTDRRDKGRRVPVFPILCFLTCHELWPSQLDRLRGLEATHEAEEFHGNSPPGVWRPL